MKKLVTFVVIGLILNGCASTKRSGSTEASPMRDLPEWFLNVPEAEDAIYGVGSAKKQNPSLAKKIATARARDEIAQTVNTKVATMLSDFMQETGVGENAQALEFTTSVSKQVSDVSLEGSKIQKTYPAKDGTIYVLVVYPLGSVRDTALEEVKKREALYNEFKAGKGFEALEEAVKELK